MSEYVLVIDDDDDTREVMGSVLTDMGYSVVCVASAAAAIEHLATNPAPAVILVDTYMAGVDGFAFRRWQVADPSVADIPVIALSAAAGVEKRWRDAGVTAFLPKPFDMEKLFAMLDGHVPQPSHVRAKSPVPAPPGTRRREGG